MTAAANVRTPSPLELDKIWATKPPPIDFVLPGLARATVGNMVSAGGTGKTFVMLQTVFGVAVGRDIGDLWGVAPAQGPAVFLSLEDPEEVLAMRLHEMKDLMTPDERRQAVGVVKIIPGAGVEGLQISKGGQELRTSDWFAAFRAELGREHRPRLVVVDTLNRLLGGLGENDSGPMGWVLRQLEVLAREVGAAVIMCHHVSKASLANKVEDEAHAARGSSAITDNARWQVNLAILPKGDARAKGMSTEERRRHVKLEITKSNYGPPAAERWLERQAGGILRHSQNGPNPSAPPPPAGGATASAKPARRPSTRRVV